MVLDIEFSLQAPLYPTRVQLELNSGATCSSVYLRFRHFPYNPICLFGINTLQKLADHCQQDPTGTERRRASRCTPSPRAFAEAMSSTANPVPPGSGDETINPQDEEFYASYVLSLLPCCSCPVRRGSGADAPM